MIWDFYEYQGTRPIYVKIPGNQYKKYPPTGDDHTTAIAHDLCMNNFFYYYAWFIWNVFVTIFRVISFLNMFRAQRFLSRRDEEKAKKKARKREKLRKERKV